MLMLYATFLPLRSFDRRLTGSEKKEKEQSGIDGGSMSIKFRKYYFRSSFTNNKDASVYSYAKR